jgi:Divergent InlB B-repeat domain
VGSVDGRCGSDRRGRKPRRLRLALVVAALGAGALSLPGASAAPQAGTLTIVVHGQGRVQSVSSTLIDCPTRCSASFPSPTTIQLRATANEGHALGQWGAGSGCGELAAECTVSVGSVNRTIDVYFRPRARLQVWPAGRGTVTLSPPGTDARGEPADPACSDTTVDEQTGCLRYFLPNTSVSAGVMPGPGSTFVGWSRFGCTQLGPCQVTLDRDELSLTARFSPLPVNVIKVGNDTGTIVSEPAGIACPPTCSGVNFPFGSQVTLVAIPNPAFPFVRWIFGCTPSPTDPRRCTFTVTNFPQWVGVAVGEDGPAEPPSTVTVDFEVRVAGQGDVRGVEIDCGNRCVHRYGFGQRESLTARPAGGWRLADWEGTSCGREPGCVLHVGPVTSIRTVFVQNLAPQLLGIASSGKGATRRLVVRIGVARAARARLTLRRVGAAKASLIRQFPLQAGQNRLVLSIPRSAKAGRYRLTIAVSDDLGGGRTYVRIRRLGP